MPDTSFDVIVLGGGPAGYVCAIRAAQLGMKTAVVERDKLGGVCVNIGCIPTKALLYSARVANIVRHEAKGLGVEAGSVTLDFAVAMKRSRVVSEQNSKGVAFLMKKHKINVIAGEGTLAPGRRVTVAGTEYTAKTAVILATGSRVKGLPRAGLELNGTTVISSDDALVRESAPATLAIVGAGAVGVEFADIYNAFGTKVTLLEVLPRILPLEDSEASDAIAKSFRKRKIDVLAGAKVGKAAVKKNGVTLEVEVAGETKSVQVDAVLVAAGRAPNVEGMGLEEAGVRLSPQGFVQVDGDLRTTAEGVYAIGDVAGPPMLAHKGSREGVHVAETLAGLATHPIRYDNIPSVTYCHPEVASIGITEEQAKERKLDVTIGRFPLSASGRARASNETEGFVKIVRDAKYGEILGAHIVAGHASEMIHELTVARESEYTVEEVELAVHAHPTLSEAIAEAALDSMGRALNI